jgi:GNAT superfamily N-acetyltransferase
VVPSIFPTKVLKALKGTKAKGADWYTVWSERLSPCAVKASRITNDLSVRAATTADVPALIALYIAFHAFHVAGVPDRLRVPERYDIPLIRTTLDDYIQRPDVALLVAEHHQQVIGFVEVHVKEDPVDRAVVFHRYGHIQSLMVAESRRKSGVGRALLRAAQAWAARQGIAQLRLDLWEFAAGPLPFYEHLGFHTIKRTMTIDVADATW